MIDQLAEQWLEEFKRGFRKRVRFAVRSPQGRYSAAWVTANTKNDFYIGARSVMGSFKLSLHKSGICRLAFDTKYFASAVHQGLIPPEQDRALAKWRRSPTPVAGAVLVVGLFFATDFLHLGEPIATAKEPFVFLDTAPQGKAVEIAFFYSREPVTTLEPKLLEFGMPLFWADLENGDIVWMVGREADFVTTALPSVETLNSVSGRLLDPDGFAKAGVERRHLTANLWNAPKDNEALVLIEMGGMAISGDVTTFLSSLFHSTPAD